MKLSDAQVAAYLERLDYRAGLEVGVQTLSDLHWHHLQRVPFENLDISLGIPIELSPKTVFEKVVERRRGGFCYELNFAFSLLLKALGFDLRLLSGQVYKGESYGQPFDHMLLQVFIEEDSWIADVGFGDSFRRPLMLGIPVDEQLGVQYRIERGEGPHYFLSQRKKGEDWSPQYRFTLESHALEAFEPMCRYHQSSPDSSFTRKSVCSIATPEGRITFSNGRWIETRGGQRREEEIRDFKVLRNLLRTHHGVELPVAVPLDRFFIHG